MEQPLVRPIIIGLDMGESKLSADPDQQHEAAYDAHYRAIDLIAAHSRANEEGCSDSRVQNTMNALIPKEEIIDSLVELVRIYFDQRAPLDAEQALIEIVD
ncbi:hypothetical protein [Desulfatibacillum aliphaticivorans]|uniref:hypothetical protein n=1 Tax=Desulfatibacillum aliphaticivorans TaxID=218208 RepID=UPI0004800DD0|nr:hypothetical protein [Desulfatibacillum aliphaticivorans]